MSTEYTPTDPTGPDHRWYLGLDIGGGLSACLLNRSTGRVYPVYWKAKTPPSSKGKHSPTGEITYRLPCRVDCPQMPGGSRRSLENFRPYLNIAIPYVRISQDSASEVSQVPIPLIQLSDRETVFLGKFQRALQLLLSTLAPFPQKQLKGLMLPKLYACGAVGLDVKMLRWVLQHLTGVIVGFPAGATEAYRFNVEKAILDARLVETRQQIFWLEEAIAILLNRLRGGGMMSMSGGTALAIDAGATTTEIAGVELPEPGADLTRANFVSHGWAYGGDALELDIVCQLLLDSPAGKLLESEAFPDEDLIRPEPGSPDWESRYRLQQQLRSRPLGAALWEAAKSLKRTLPERKRQTLEIEGYRWELSSKDLERLVLAPFIDRLNAELNRTLAKAGISSIGITQAFCSGENGGWTALHGWLRQKLPSAAIVCEDGSADVSPDVSAGRSPDLQVATGLAALPLYPEVLDRPRHQYRDFFLLKELLNGFEGEALSADAVMRVLERRGINTRSCYSRILSILRDGLPPGLVPREPEMVLIHPASRQTPDYQRFGSGGLFVPESGDLYRLDPERAGEVRQYLNQLFSGDLRALEEPTVISPLLS